jgi:hypothetical protein
MIAVRWTLLVLSLAAAPAAWPYARYCASHDTLQFGNRAVGSTTHVTVEVSNCGDEAWRFGDVSLHAATGTAWHVTSACATQQTLQPGERCTIDVTFAPLVAGQTSGALWLRQTTTTPDQLLTFYGRGVTASAGTAQITFTPSTADFGDVANGARTAPMTVVLRNSGAATLVPSALVVNGAHPYDFGTISYGDAGDCSVGRAVAAGASCTLNLTFAPAAAGPRSAQVVVDAPQLASLVALPLRGRGIDTTRGSVEAIEFFHAARNHYFLTTVPEEAAHIDSGGVGPGWARTGQRFRVWPVEAEAPVGAADVCRFFGTPHLGPEAHFFTANAVECDLLKHNRYWIDEGLAFRTLPAVGDACPAPYVPVTRLYYEGADATAVRHRYVRDASLVPAMLRSGWRVEGVAFCSPS